jgi:hypothetical protein
MALETRNGFAAPPRTEKELRALYSRVVKKITAMTPEQRLATLVRAGIYTKSGKLTKHYRGCEKRPISRSSARRLRDGR